MLWQNTPASGSLFNADDCLEFFKNTFDSIREMVIGPGSSQNGGCSAQGLTGS